MEIEQLLENVYNSSSERTLTHRNHILNVEREIITLLGGSKLLLELEITIGLVEKEHIETAYRIGKKSYADQNANQNILNGKNIDMKYNDIALNVTRSL